MTNDPGPPIAVVDTNVLVDLHSCHDLAAEFEAQHAIHGAAAADERSVVYRRVRARESLLLALYFDMIRATTVSLQSEALTVLTTRVPPEEESLEMHYTTLFQWFVTDFLLSGWAAQAATPSPGWDRNLSTAIGLALDSPEWVAPTGDNADAWHFAFAKEHGLPLITNEGFSQTGYKRGKLRKRAEAEGVHVFFPKDFYAGKIDEAVAIETFLGRFLEYGPHYLESRPTHRNALNMMYGIFRHILLGETEGRDTPVRLSILTSKRRRAP